MCGANECSIHWARRTSRPSNPKTLEYWAKSVFISGKDSISSPPPCSHALLGETRHRFPLALPFATEPVTQRRFLATRRLRGNYRLEFVSVLRLALCSGLIHSETVSRVIVYSVHIGPLQPTFLRFQSLLQTGGQSVRASCAFSLLAVDRPTSGWRQA